MRTRPRLTPQFLHLLCLGWLLGIRVTSALGGVFQVVEEPPHDPTVAMVRQHLQGPLRVWTTVLTELFRLPTDVTVTLASCGRIDAFYSSTQQRIYLCDELLTYFAQVFAPPEDSATAVRAVTLFTFFHVVGHALIQALDLPVSGPSEEAADELGAVFLVAGEAEDEQAVLAGSRVLFQRSGVPFSSPPRWCRSGHCIRGLPNDTIASTVCSMAATPLSTPCSWRTVGSAPRWPSSVQRPGSVRSSAGTHSWRPICVPQSPPRTSHPLWRSWRRFHRQSRPCAHTMMPSTTGSMPTPGSGWRRSLSRRASAVRKTGATNSPAIAPGGSSWPPWKFSICTSTSSSQTRRSCRPRYATPCTADT
jgi:hypothetical protein